MNQAPSHSIQKPIPFLKKLDKGDLLFSQGNELKSYFRIKSGLIKTHRVHESGGKSILNIKIQGEFLGEFREEKNRKFHNYSASALEDNTMVEIIPLEEKNTLSLHLMLETLQAEIQSARSRLERVLYQDAQDRIKQTLKDLGVRLGKKFGNETLLKISLTHEDLAILADTSRQTVTTVLSELKNQNKINYSRGRILFRNLENF